MTGGIIPPHLDKTHRDIQEKVSKAVEALEQARGEATLDGIERAVGTAQWAIQDVLFLILQARKHSRPVSWE